MNLFSLICFLALTDDHGRSSWEETFPDYLAEKVGIINGPPDMAYAALDHSNQRRVLRYCEKMHIQLPKEVEEYEKEMPF